MKLSVETAKKEAEEFNRRSDAYEQKNEELTRKIKVTSRKFYNANKRTKR